MRKNEGKLVEKELICPVCRQRIDEVNLPDERSVVEDNLYFLEGVVIVGSAVKILVDFEHRYEALGVTMDDPHLLRAVIACAFDGAGKCVRFEVVELRAGR